jgi:hypothetical protein
VDAGHGTVGHEIGQDVARVGAMEADVREAPGRGPIAGDPQVLEGPLDPEEVGVGAGAGLREEEAALADPNLDLQGRPPAEKSLEPERALDPARQDLEIDGWDGGRGLAQEGLPGCVARAPSDPASASRLR